MNWRYASNMRRHFQGALGTDSSGIPYIVLGEDWYFDFSPPEMLRKITRV